MMDPIELHNWLIEEKGFYSDEITAMKKIFNLEFLKNAKTQGYFTNLLIQELEEAPENWKELNNKKFDKIMKKMEEGK